MNVNNATNSYAPTSMDIWSVDPANRSSPADEAVQNAQKDCDNLMLLADTAILLELKTNDLPINSHFITNTSNNLISLVSSLDDSSDTKGKDEAYPLILLSKTKTVEQKKAENYPEVPRGRLYICGLVDPAANGPCDESFSSKENLKVHERIFHRYNCGTCKKFFTYRDSLIQHYQTTHTEKKPRPYVCNECGKCFYNTSNLKGHKVTHTDNKPHTCEICHKTFIRMFDLKTHRKTHIVEQCYVCAQCGQIFTKKINCIKHNKKLHSKEGVHCCKLCDKTFIDRYSLNQHKKSHMSILEINVTRPSGSHPAS